MSGYKEYSLSRERAWALMNRIRDELLDMPADRFTVREILFLSDYKDLESVGIALRLAERTGLHELSEKLRREVEAYESHSWHQARPCVLQTDSARS